MGHPPAAQRIECEDAMADPDTSPPAPEELFAEYHQLRSSADATAAAYDALAKRARAAKRAWSKLADAPRANQLRDLLNYIAQSKPVEPAALLTPEALLREVASLRKAARSARAGALKGRVLGLWRRLQDTRGQLERDPDHDSDHDELVDGQEQLFDLAQQLGVDLHSD